MELIKTEKQEHSIVELTIEITKAEIEAAKDKVFKKEGKKISVPGFRKGKAPRRIVEKLYGEDIFFEKAFDILYPEAMDMALEKSEITPVGQVQFDLGEPSEPGALTFIAKVPVKPEVELGQYKGIEVEKETVEVPESTIEAELNRMAKSNARTETVEREARDGDTLDIDFEGFMDNEPFEGGEAEHYMLTLGSGAFIPGFEDQLVGCRAGDEKEVNVTFPEQYHVEELAGKEAVFKCKINKVEETIMPELDDEFAKDVSDTCETLDDLKKEIEDNLRKEREEAADHVFENKLIEAAVANMTADIPEAMFEAQIDRDIQEFNYKLNSRGLELGRYLEISGMNIEKLRESFREQAVSSTKGRLMLEKVVELENITVSDKEIEDEYAKMAEQYGMELDRVKELIKEDILVEDLKVSNALEFLKSQAVVKMVPPKSPDAEEA